MRPKNFRVKTKKVKYHKTTHRKQNINLFEKTKRQSEKTTRYLADRATRKARTHLNNLRVNGLTGYSNSTRYQNNNNNFAFRKIRKNTNINEVKKALMSARNYNNAKTSSVNGVLGSIQGSLNAILKNDLGGKSFTKSQVKDIINKGGIHTTSFWDAVQKTRDKLGWSRGYRSDDIINEVVKAVDEIEDYNNIGNEAYLQPNDGGKGMNIKVFSTSLTNATKINENNAEAIADIAYNKLKGVTDTFNGEMVARPK